MAGGRPKGSFKTPEQIAALSPSERAKYFENHRKYLKKSEGQKNRERRRRWLVSKDKDQFLKDTTPVPYDKYPETTLRIWLQSHCPTSGHLRFQAARWATSNYLLSEFLMGFRMIEQDTLRNIAYDTEIKLEELLDQFDIIRFDKKEKEPVDE